MTTMGDIKNYARLKSVEHDGQQPIYQIFLFQYPDRELAYKKTDGTVKHSGFPDIGNSADVGFYYELDSAIEALNNNAMDMRETIYNAGFILCKFPGLYECCSSFNRMYFVWDDSRMGFYQTEEPKIFSHVAY